MKRFPIAPLKKLAKEYGLTEVIMVARDEATGMTHVVTYGKTLEDCLNAAESGNNLKKWMGWPDELCHEVPKRAATAKIRGSKLGLKGDMR